MSHSLIRVWIHGVFGTKSCHITIPTEHESKLLQHLRNTLENDLKCPVRIINSGIDHIHVLFLLSPAISIQDLFHRLKGESSHWWNQNDFTLQKFGWQPGYAAFSISETAVKKVECYIRNQKEHHKKRTFDEEYNAFIAEVNKQSGNQYNNHLKQPTDLSVGKEEKI